MSLRRLAHVWLDNCAVNGDSCSGSAGEEVVLQVLDLLFELAAGLGLEAVQQVLLQVVKGLDVGGAVARGHVRKHVDQLAPLLGLGKNEHERVEKLGGEVDGTVQGSLEEALCHLKSTLLLLLVIEKHQVTSN